jgi:hypothetical protein
VQHIDEQRLEQDSAYRFQYLAEFMQFGEHDLAAVAAVRPVLLPNVPVLVDVVYEKLAMYDCTWRHFMPAQTGQDEAAVGSLSELSLDHPQIRFRKQHLTRYVERLLSGPYDGKLVLYLDMVGKIHTAEAGNPRLQIPLVQMNALLGFVADALIATLLASRSSAPEYAPAIRAFSKLLWIQNDFINRHYAQRLETTPQ